MLVLTPPPRSTECLSGYLHSLAAANGYDRPTYVVSHLKRFRKLNDLRLVGTDDIRQLAGLDQSIAERLCMQPKKRGCRNTMRLLGQVLHVSEARMDVFRVCPLCVGETGRHEAAWHIRSMIWCPVHRIPMLETCETCGKKLAWNRPSVSCCRCGADLTVQGGRETCSESVGRLMAAFRWVLYRDRTVQGCPSELAHLESLDLYALNRLVTALCSQIGAKDGYSNECAGKVTAVTLEIVAEALDNWPFNFHVFLKEQYEDEIVADRWGEAFRSRFYWAFEGLRRNLRGRGHLFGFLIDEIYRFGARYISRERLVRGSKLRVPVSFAWGSVLEAAAISGLDPRTMYKKIRNGEVPVLDRAGPWGPRSVLVDLDWIKRWKVSRYASVNPRIAALTLDLPQKLFLELRRAEVFPVMYRTSRENGCSEEDVEIYRRVLDRLVSSHSGDGTIGGIARAGVSIRSTKSLVLRVEMLRVLIALDPGLWEQEDIHRDRMSATDSDVEIHLGSCQHSLNEDGWSSSPHHQMVRTTVCNTNPERGCQKV